MAKKETKKDLVPVEPQSLARFDPAEEMKFAIKVSKALTSLLETKKKPVIINGEKYAEFEDWQTIARFFNTTVGTENTKKIVDNGEFKGYDATAVVFNSQGIKIGSAEASCLKEESNWATKPEFQLKSMAQTRAMAKALRSIFGWVMVLAGVKATPAEEMDGVKNTKTDVKADVAKAKEEVVVEEVIDEPFPSKNPARKPATKQKNFCVDCKIGITDKVCSFSLDVYDMPLCMKCQPNHKKTN